VSFSVGESGEHKERTLFSVNGIFPYGGNMNLTEELLAKLGDDLPRPYLHLLRSTLSRTNSLQNDSHIPPKG